MDYFNAMQAFVHDRSHTVNFPTTGSSWGRADSRPEPAGPRAREIHLRSAVGVFSFEQSIKPVR